MTGQLLPVRTALPPTPTLEDYQALNRGLEGASNPAWVGTDFFRWYELDGSRLTLRTNPNSTTPLIWERIA